MSLKQNQTEKCTLKCIVTSFIMTCPEKVSICVWSFQHYDDMLPSRQRGPTDCD